MRRFTIPKEIYYGNGSLEALKSIIGKKAMICTGGTSMKKNGFIDKAIEYLKAAKIDVKILDGIEPDPTVKTVLKGAESMREFKPDWIIAMGGGSAIDGAKAMWTKYEHPDLTFE